MNMKQHILEALREVFDDWESLLAALSEEQITAPRPPSTWSIKDNVAHMMAWQKRSIARMQAAKENREPEFPNWPTGADPDSEENTERTNAWIYETYRAQPWSNVHQEWREGFLRFLQAAEAITEQDLLSDNKYPWMKPYPLVEVLLGSYDHHKEHLYVVQSHSSSVLSV